ncbi:MAG: leucine-rich repeat protein, partial [Alistipes sp.]
LITALEEKDFVTSVTELADKSGYTITFSKSGPITIKHGQKGADAIAPVVGVKQDVDGKYYWTLDGDFILSGGGDKIPTTGDKGATGDDGVTPHIGENGNWWIGTTDTGVKAQGDAGVTPHIGDNGNWWIGTTDTGVKAQGEEGVAGITPQVRIDEATNMWEISMDAGATWTSTGVRATGRPGAPGRPGADGADGADGDAIFAKDGIDTSDSNNVTFTLADGVTKITLPRYIALKIGDDNSAEILSITTIDETDIALVLPSGFKESDYSAIMAEAKNNAGTSTDIKTRAITNPLWQVKVTKPTFTNGVCNQDAKITITPPSQSLIGDNAILRVTMINSNGNEVVSARALKFTGMIVEGGQLSTIEKAWNVKYLTVKGTMTDADFAFIRAEMTALKCLDLSGTDLTALPVQAFCFNGSSGSNYTLEQIILPQSLKSIGDFAFLNSGALKYFELPDGVTTLGQCIFQGCEALETVKIPSQVTEIPAWTFYNATGLTYINIPETVTLIGDAAFAVCPKLDYAIIKANITSIPYQMFTECSSLNSVILPKTLTSIGEAAFQLCTNLEYVQIPSSVTSIGGVAFSGCKFQTLTLPAGLLTIGKAAFGSCKQLKKIEIPVGVTDIPMQAFNECHALKTLTIKGAVTSIGGHAFRECFVLNNVTLPASLTILRDRAFQDCTGMTSLKCLAPTIPTLETDETGDNYKFHFLGLKANCVLSVPDAAVYGAWSSYFKEIKAIPIP